MTARMLEVAITKLIDLYDEVDQSEQLYQRWFEENSLVFELLGYTRVLHHPRLVSSSGEVFVPDFMVQTTAGIWKIFEIKRPDTNILKDVSRRQDFYSLFTSYVRQCREYSTFFEDEQNRLRFNATYTTNIQRRVEATLIAGMNEGLDRARANDLIVERGLLNFESYDDLLERLDVIRRSLHGEGENLAGLSVHMGGRLPRVLADRTFE